MVKTHRPDLSASQKKPAAVICGAGLTVQQTIISECKMASVGVRPNADHRSADRQGGARTPFCQDRRGVCTFRAGAGHPGDCSRGRRPPGRPDRTQRLPDEAGRSAGRQPVRRARGLSSDGPGTGGGRSGRSHRRFRRHHPEKRSRRADARLYRHPQRGLSRSRHGRGPASRRQRTAEA
uniref:Ketoacyl_synth_N domain-containing protein n=1 Tax=Parastrongyloides trichosuri TaxID=131310 RepID=A0A0N4ZLG8_PARTI